jgi:hypothetical protein
MKNLSNEENIITRTFDGIISRIEIPHNKMYLVVYLTSYDEQGRFTLQNNKNLLKELKEGDTVTVSFKIILRKNYNDLIIKSISKRK